MRSEPLVYVICVVLLAVSLLELRQASNGAQPLEPLRPAPYPASQVLMDASLLEGSPNAGWKAIEFLDYECVPCAMAEKRAQSIRAQLGSKVAWYVRQFPLAMHPGARDLAILALLAAQRGKLAEVHAWLYANQALPFQRKRQTVLSLLELSEPAYEALRKQAVKIVDRQLKEDRELLLSGTPSVMLISPGGEVFRGSMPEQVELTLNSGS